MFYTLFLGNHGIGPIAHDQIRENSLALAKLVGNYELCMNGEAYWSFNSRKHLVILFAKPLPGANSLMAHTRGVCYTTDC